MKISIPDMHCGKCKAKIEDALFDADEAAEIDFDLEGRTLDLRSALSADEALAAISKSGYSAEITG